MKGTTPDGARSEREAATWVRAWAPTPTTPNRVASGRARYLAASPPPAPVR